MDAKESLPENNGNARPFPVSTDAQRHASPEEVAGIPSSFLELAQENETTTTGPAHHADPHSLVYPAEAKEKGHFPQSSFDCPEEHVSDSFLSPEYEESESEWERSSDGESVAVTPMKPKRQHRRPNPVSSCGSPLKGSLSRSFRQESSASSTVSVRASTFGLVNEGCTCYLNSLLQLLYHTGYFRSAVYHIPDTERDVLGSSPSPKASPEALSPTARSGIPKPKVYRSLQELFYLMQVRSAPNKTTRLTDAFGWKGDDLFVQHDIQELAALLRDRLEERMAGTVAEGAINRLFEGKGEQVVLTLDGTFTSRRRDVFYDIHLPLKGFTDLYSSLASLTDEDRLEGDNKYLVEEKDKPSVYKEATKSYRFLRFPPVIWFHLKRFSMDMSSDTMEMKKLNSRLAFPPVLDLTSLEHGEDGAAPHHSSTTASRRPSCQSRQNERRRSFSKHSSRSATGTDVTPIDIDAEEGGSGSFLQMENTFTTDFTHNSPAIYDLHGVIVHRGTVASGHYFCYIREWDEDRERFGRWIQYDDESVRVVSPEEAIERNYGGRPGEAAEVPSRRPDGGPRKRQPRPTHSTSQHQSNGSSPVPTTGMSSTPVGSSTPASGQTGSKDLFEVMSQSTASAYIVAYVRRSDAERILAEPGEKALSAPLRRAIQRELDEEARQMRLEQERRESLTLYVITDRVLTEWTATQHAVHFRLPPLAQGTNSESSFLNTPTDGLQYPVDFALQLRKSDLVQHVYEILLGHPSLDQRGLTPENVRLWQWDPLNGGCAFGDRSWNTAACVALPTHAECLHRTTPFTNFIPASELHRPVTMYLYLEEPTPFTRVVPALSVQPLVKRFRCIEPGTYKISLRKAVHVGVLSLVLGGRSNRPALPSKSFSSSESTAMHRPTTEDCGIELVLLNTATGEYTTEPMQWYAVDRDPPILHLPLRLAAAGSHSPPPQQTGLAAAWGAVKTRPQDSSKPKTISSGRGVSVPSTPNQNRTTLFPPVTLPTLIDDITITCVERSTAPNASQKSTVANCKAVQPLPVPSPSQNIPLRILDIHVQMTEGHMRNSVVNDGSAMEDVGQRSVTLFGIPNCLDGGAPSTSLSMEGEDWMRSSVSRPVSPSLCTAIPSHQLPVAGPDRILLFFKFFDFLSCTVRYLGAAHVDRCCTLRSCEPLLHRLLGFPYVKRSVSGGQHQLAFFVEETNGTCRELGSSNDLWNCRLSCGAVVVAQYLNVPPIYRHTVFSSYAQYVGQKVKVTIVQMDREVVDNREAVAKVLRKLRRRFELLEDQKRMAGPPPLLEEEEEEEDVESRKKPRSGALHAAAAALASFQSDPYQSSVPVMGPSKRRVVGMFTCHMTLTWTYLAICDAVASVLHHDANRLELYQNLGGGVEGGTRTAEGQLTAAADPIPVDSSMTLREMIELPSAASPAAPPQPSLFVETLDRLRHPSRFLTLVTQLRDADGHALHRKELVLGYSTPLRVVVQQLLDSIEPWEKDMDPYGTFAATCAATHFVLVVMDTEHHLIARTAEVPMHSRQGHPAVLPPAAKESEKAVAARSASSSSRSASQSGGDPERPKETNPGKEALTAKQQQRETRRRDLEERLCLSDVLGPLLSPHLPALQPPPSHRPPPSTQRMRPLKLALCLQPAASLPIGHHRIPCCHADFGRRDPRAACFGQPFLITASGTATIHEGLAKMLEATHLRPDQIHPPPQSVMMRTTSLLSFREWGDTISSVWKYNPNHGPYPSHLVLNHVSPAAAEAVAAAVAHVAAHEDQGRDSAAASSHTFPAAAGKKLMIPHEVATHDPTPPS